MLLMNFLLYWKHESWVICFLRIGFFKVTYVMDLHFLLQLWARSVIAEKEDYDK